MKELLPEGFQMTELDPPVKIVVGGEVGGGGYPV
jgi:hypothetical protein